MNLSCRVSWLVIGAMTSVGVIQGAAPAGAHVKPNKAKAKAGSRQEIRFTIEHGCNGSPTTKLTIKLPKGVTVPVPTKRTGWTASVTADTVIWSGGTLGAKTKGEFGLTMTFPNTRGVTLGFPMVQTCKTGTVRWIEGPQSDYPTPTVALT
jgi:periplasmic copper chaperone A